MLNAFNQEKALVGVVSVIVQFRRLIVCSTNFNIDVGTFVRGCFQQGECIVNIDFIDVKIV